MPKSDEVSGWPKPELRQPGWVETCERVQALDEESILKRVQAFGLKDIPECGFDLPQMIELLGKS